jgi:predicted dehydrogenase
VNRIALIGCGHIGTVHSYALGQLSRAGLIDACVATTFDTDLSRAEEVARHHRAAVAGSLEEALEGADVAWICTWTSEHLRAVRAACDRGMATFCEKPLAPTLDDCRLIAAALEQVPHQVGLVLRHAPVFRNAAKLIGSGRFGKPLALTLRNDQYFPIQGVYGSTWRSDVQLAGGGTLIEHSIHDVDLISWLLGPPDRLSASTSSMFGFEGIEDSATVVFEHASGVIATLVSIWHRVMSRPSTRRLEIFFEEAFAWTEDDYLGPLHVQTSDGLEEIAGAAPPWTDRLGVPEVYAKPLAQYCEPSKEFLDKLATSGDSARGEPDVRTALAAHELVDAAYRSAARGVR